MNQKSSTFSNLSTLALQFRQDQLSKLHNDKVILKSEPEWLNGPECRVCSVPFTSLEKRQHHCRVCGYQVCGSCSNKQVNDSRACDLCFLRIQMFDVERQKKAHLKNKNENIDSTKKKIETQRQLRATYKLELEGLRKKREVQLVEQRLLLKSLDESIRQKSEQLKLARANNERQQKNIQVERGQIRETELQIEAIKTEIGKKQVNMTLKITIHDSNIKMLEDKKRCLQEVNEKLNRKLNEPPPLPKRDWQVPQKSEQKNIKSTGGEQQQKQSTQKCNIF